MSGSCWGVFDGESSQCWSSFLGPALFLLYINDLRDDIIRNNAICDDDTILSSRCDQVSDLGLCLELTSELECDFVICRRNWLVDFIAGKTQLVSFDWSTDATDVKID